MSYKKDVGFNGYCNRGVNNNYIYTIMGVVYNAYRVNGRSYVYSVLSLSTLGR